MKKVLRATAIAGIAALALAGCGDAPDEEAGGGNGAGGDATASDFHACMVTDAGGVDDRSFNASAWQGLQEAEEQLGIEADYVESNSPTDYAPNVQQMVAGDCGLIVTVGFLLGDATKAAAEANADEQFAIVDFQYEEPVENIRPLIFDTAQAAFLAGYVAADTTKTGTVATFGGINIPTVSIFMDGFVDGVAYYNEQKGKDVKVLGWDKDAQNGSFTGDFDNQANGKNLANTFIQQGADIIMPVAGPVGLGAAAAAQEAGDVMIVGVDSDWFESASQYKDIILTSVVKEIDAAVLDTAKSASEDNFTNEPYVGTLENEGVSIAPFHEFESQVNPDLQQEVDDLKEKIISGEVTVESPSSPKS